MRSAYRRVENLGDVVAWLGELRSRTVLFDVEPLVAAWDTGPDILRRGVDETLAQVLRSGQAEVVGFVTNSLRHHQIGARPDGAHVFYHSRAWKPLRAAKLRDLPRPAMLVGDQVVTDGLLAWRLGHAFAHVQPAGPRPRGPQLANHLGRPLIRALFEER